MSTHEVKITPQEEALGQLFEETEEVLSEAARTLVSEAHKASYALYLACSLSYGPEDCEEAVQKMRLEATRLTDSDREHLAKIVRTGEAAASSIDPDDQTPAGHKVWRGDVHCYYQMMSALVDDALHGR